MITIKILGIGRKLMEIEDRVRSVMFNNPFPVKMELINNLDEIMTYNVEKIPSIIINDNVVSEGRIPSSTEVHDELYKSFYNQLKWKTVENILVPVDFSDVSANALKYACAISETNGASINLIHVSRGVNNWKNPTDNDLESGFSKTNKMNRMVEWGRDILGTKKCFNVTYDLGMTVDIIVENSSKYDLIIMGSTGEHGMADKWMGSVSSLVARDAKCPVLLIPPSSIDFKSLDKVVVAFKEGIEEDIKLGNMPKLTTKMDFDEVHLVNVISGKEGTKAFSDDIIKKVHNGAKHVALVKARHIQGDSIIEAVNQYAEDKEMDLIVVVSERRNLLERLLHKSQTSAMIMDIKKPVLVLHH